MKLLIGGHKLIWIVFKKVTTKKVAVEGSKPKLLNLLAGKCTRHHSVFIAAMCTISKFSSQSELFLDMTTYEGSFDTTRTQVWRTRMVMEIVIKHLFQLKTNCIIEISK